jgi:hypothetical protein
MSITCFASFNQSNTELVLILSPFVLLILALIIFLVARATTLARTFLACYTLALAWMYWLGEPWHIPTKLWDQPFVVTWYSTAWIDLALLPCLAVWLWAKSRTSKS